MTEYMTAWGVWSALATFGPVSRVQSLRRCEDGPYVHTTETGALKTAIGSLGNEGTKRKIAAINQKPARRQK